MKNFIETPCGYTFIKITINDDEYYYDVYDCHGSYLGEIGKQEVNDNIIWDSEDDFVYDMDGLEILADDLI